MLFLSNCSANQMRSFFQHTCISVPIGQSCSSFTIIKWSGACMHKSSLGVISLLDGMAWPGLVLHVFTIFCTTGDTLSITFETFPNSILRFLSPFLDRSQLLPLFIHHHSVLTSTAQPFLSSIQIQCFHIRCLLYFVKSPP